MNDETFEGFGDQLKDLRPEVKENALELAGLSVRWFGSRRGFKKSYSRR